MDSHLPTGEYVLHNALYHTFAAAVNSNDEEPAKSVTVPVGVADDGNTGHRWVLTRFVNGTYTIRNKTHDVYAHNYGQATSVATSPSSKRTEEYWYIHSVGASGYQIKTVVGDRCWSLSRAGHGEQVNLVDVSSAQSALWIFQSDTGQYPSIGFPEGLARSSISPYDVNRSAVMFDFQADSSGRQKLDVVILLTVESRLLRDIAGTAVRIMSSELHRLAKENTLVLDIRLGVVIYSRGDAGWSLSTGWLDTNNALIFEQDSSPSSGPYAFNRAMQKSIEMKWREGSAQVLVFIPKVSPPDDPGERRPSGPELIGQVKAARMLLVLDAPQDLRIKYMKAIDFFGELATISPHETVVLPENMMANWIIASTLYKYNIKNLTSELKSYAKPWLESETLKQLREAATSLRVQTTEQANQPDGSSSAPRRPRSNLAPSQQDSSPQFPDDFEQDHRSQSDSDDAGSDGNYGPYSPSQAGRHNEPPPSHDSTDFPSLAQLLEDLDDVELEEEEDAQGPRAVGSRRRRSSRASGGREDDRVAVFDFQAIRKPTSKIDVVTIFHLDDPDTYDDAAEELDYAMRFTTSFPVSMRYGQVLYSDTDDGGSVSIVPFGPPSWSTWNRARVSTFDVYPKEHIKSALQAALQMNWRGDAAKVIIVYATAPPLFTTDPRASDPPESELIEELESRRMLLILRAEGVLRSTYLYRVNLFRALRAHLPMVYLPSPSMIDWICQSTFSRTDISTLCNDFRSSECVPFYPEQGRTRRNPPTYDILSLAAQWPRPPLDWDLTKAFDFYNKLPNTLDEVATLAWDDWYIRARLLHVLPFLKSWDHGSYMAIKNADFMQNFCANFFLEGETVYCCYDCGINDKCALFCKPCWESISHKGHRRSTRKASENGWGCDCGEVSGSYTIGEGCDVHTK